MEQEQMNEYFERMLEEFACISETLTDISVHLETANNLKRQQLEKTTYVGDDGYEYKRDI